MFLSVFEGDDDLTTAKFLNSGLKTVFSDTKVILGSKKHEFSFFFCKLYIRVLKKYRNSTDFVVFDLPNSLQMYQNKVIFPLHES